MEPSHKHTNRLSGETSPYLLQHAHNPVDWHPWGEEAIRKAREQDKPIFLSIGYSACHWCHVMERESFENPHIAKILNDHFICIKVDREERPDLDTIYMKSVQLLTGHGGWPMSVFLTPELNPYFGGTYFPPEDRMGMPGFGRVAEQLGRLYRERASDVVSDARRITDAIKQMGDTRRGDGEISEEGPERLNQALGYAFDPNHGGFSQAPKFPHAADMAFLLRYGSRKKIKESIEMTAFTLTMMARGGIYDQLGGGFARYSTDPYWLVPHFEKMLYDNALLVPVYLDAFRITGREMFARAASRTLDWVLEEMTRDGGGFYSALDADSEGVEGKFYVWTKEQVMALLGEADGEAVCHYYDVTGPGNFEHQTNILHVAHDEKIVADRLGITAEEMNERLRRAEAKLKAERDRRIRPGLDDKTLTSWNGMMIAAMADGYRALGNARYLRAAEEGARFILGRMRGDDGRLMAAHNRGKSHLNGYLDDYAWTLQGLLALHQATLDPAWLVPAADLAGVMVSQFWEEKTSVFYFTGKDHEELIVRSCELNDGAVPAGASVACGALLKLSVLADRPEFGSIARTGLRAGFGAAHRNPQMYVSLLQAVDWELADKREIVLAGDRSGDEFKSVMRESGGLFRPYDLMHWTADGQSDHPLLKGRGPKDGKLTAYICRGNTCSAPVTGADAILDEMKKSS